MTENNTQSARCLSRLSAELGTTSDEQQLAAAVMPCGAVVSNVYDAYDAGVKAERERCAKMIVDYSLSYGFDEDLRDLYNECAQYVRSGVLPSA
jgi:hypothetical protein